VNALLDHVWGVNPSVDRVWAQVAGIAPAQAVGRWLMALQVFIDDSYTDGGVYVLAGYLAKAEQWAAFTADWDALLPETYPGKAGIRRFKMAQMAMHMDRVARFHKIIERHLPYCVSVKLDAKDVERAMSRVWSDNIDIAWDPLFDVDVMAFTMMASTLISRLSKDDRISDLLRGERIDVYFDKHSRSDWMEDAWEAVVNDTPKEDVSIIGSGPRFECDEDFKPLQAADFIAWWIRKAYENDKLNELFSGDFGHWKGKNVPGIHGQMSEDEITGFMINRLRRSALGFTANIYDANIKPKNEHAMRVYKFNNRSGLLKFIQGKLKTMNRQRDPWGAS
jgi:hypothetical protein